MLRHLYSGTLYLLLPVVAIRLLLRGLRNRAYWQRISERFGFVPAAASSDVIWLHAVSVGEVRAALPLARALMNRYPGQRLLITTMTPTGSAQVKALFGEQVDHCYVPYDLPTAVARFLKHTRPRLALIMETELWPNLFHACRKQGIPLMVANVRMSERSMQGYLNFRRFTRDTLACVHILAVQSEGDAARLRQLGARAESLQVTGSIKFEINFPASLQAQAQALRRQWGQDRPIWVAASTHEGEDEQLLAVLHILKKRLPDLLLVLVPRHPERFGNVTRLCRKTPLGVAVRSEQQGNLATGIDILVGDTMGELALFFMAADVAFVGGSLVPTGGHNLLEPAAAGIPSVFGPHMFNFEEIARLTLERGAGVQVNNQQELVSKLADYFACPDKRMAAGKAGKAMVEENRGALEKNVVLIEGLLKK